MRLLLGVGAAAGVEEAQNLLLLGEEQPAASVDLEVAAVEAAAAGELTVALSRVVGAAEG